GVCEMGWQTSAACMNGNGRMPPNPTMGAFILGATIGSPKPYLPQIGAAPCVRLRTWMPFLKAQVHLEYSMLKEISPNGRMSTATSIHGPRSFAVALSTSP